MDKFYYDLHIHSCLSPCGDNDMTPANIAAMSMLKGLQIIAVTDHNSCKNCPAVMAACREYGIIAIPGMELTTSEEVHCLCLFPSLEKAMEFDGFVYEHLIKIPNRKDIFGEQLLYNEEDQIIGEEPNLLIQATDISFDQVYELVTNYGGILIPAHIDKNSFSLLSNLGFISMDNSFRCAEIFQWEQREALLEKHAYLKTCSLISNSDAHRLEAIHEPVFQLQCESLKREDILKSLTFLPSKV
ncbi:MAG: PHP domain-containing protein [Lachnospiraceae bacterium]|nr:PHP domain-containing protein [Lachnospiraceae bacterium]